MKRNGADLIRMLTLGGLILAGAHDAAWAGQSVTNLVTADTELKVNRYTPVYTGNALLAGTLSSEIYRELVRVHGPDVQDGYVLTNAILRLYQDWTAGYNRTVNLYRTVTDWDNAVATWYTNVTGSTWAAPGLQSGTDHLATPAATAVTPAANGFTTFNVTAEVQNFLNGTDSSLSWLVKLPTETLLVRFRTLEHTDAALRPNIVYQYASTVVRGTTVTNTATADTYIDKSSPNTSLGSGTTLLVGYLDSTKGVNRALVKMSLPAIPPSAIIESAQLRLYQDLSITSYREGGLVDLHRVLKPWSETATWKSNTVESAWAVPGLEAGNDYHATPTDTNVMPLNRHTYFDVTEDVRAFVEGSVSNHGWVAINQQESGNTLARFRTREEPTASWRPALIVRYYIPPGTVVCIR